MIERPFSSEDIIFEQLALFFTKKIDKLMLSADKDAKEKFEAQLTQLPNREDVAEVVNISFWASVRKNENRAVRFSLCWQLPDEQPSFKFEKPIPRYDNGRIIRGSTEKYTETEAKRVMKILEGNIASDRPLPETRKLFGQLLDEVIRDYQDNQRKTAKSTEQRIEKSIRPKLGHRKVKDITTAVVRDYRNQRLKTVTAGTVNRELNIISKAFSLADLPYRPKIEKLKENNIRTGFVTDAQMHSIANNLPIYLRSFARFLYITGWRRGEALRLEWRSVDFENGFVILDPGTTNDEGRRFPMTSELRTLLSNQKEFVHQLEKSQSLFISAVFVHPDGEFIKSLRRSWKSACKKAGLAHILIHDLRRSAIMNFSRKGIDQQTGMLLSGHKTSNVYRRYNIPTVDVLLEAAKKLECAGAISGAMADSEENEKTRSQLNSGK